MSKPFFRKRATRSSRTIYFGTTVSRISPTSGAFRLQWLTVVAIGAGMLAGLCGAAEPATQITARQLRCEYLVDPLGIDIRQPRLSWTLQAETRDQRQSAYRILAASDRKRLDRNEADLWDSGKVASNDTAQIVYAGKPLTSRTLCFWKVRVWDGSNRPSDWSEPAHWTMGLLSDQDWTARWIGQPDTMIPKGLNANSPWFRKVFSLDARPVRAVAYLACAGYYELHLDGHKVGDSVLAPAVSDYAHRIYYVTHDVTPLVREGKNCIALWLGRGWYVEGLPGVTHRGPIARVQLEITLEDGRTITVGSDRSWKTHNSCPTTLYATVKKENESSMPCKLVFSSRTRIFTRPASSRILRFPSISDWYPNHIANRFLPIWKRKSYRLVKDTCIPACTEPISC